MLLLLSILLVHFTYSSANEVPDFTLFQTTEGNLFVAPPDNHHLNAEAPASAKLANTSLQQISKSEKYFVWAIPKSANSSSKIDVSLFLCDTAKTYCLKKEVSATLGTIKVDTSPKNWAPIKTPTTKTHQAEKIDRFGFWMNEIDAAKANAIQQNKPLLVDFFGVWCPPCNLLDETVYPSSAFKEAAKNFVLLKIDADRPLSWELKDQFKVTGIPAVIMMNVNQKGELHEITRFVGYMQPDRVVAIMKEALALAHSSRDEYVHSLLEKAKKDPSLKSTALLKAKDLIDHYIEIKENEKAKDLIAQTKLLEPNDPGLVLREIFILPEEQQDKLTNLPNFIVKNYKTMNSDDLTTIVDTFPKFTELDKKLLTELRSRINPKTLYIPDTDISIGDIADLQEEVAEEQKDTQYTNQAYWNGIDAYQKLIAYYHHPDSRALNIELGFYLRKSKHFDEAKKLYSRLTKKFPNDATFFLGAYKLYRDIPEKENALKMAEKAWAVSYGDNQLQAVESVVHALHELGRDSEAKNLIDQYLADLKLPKLKNKTIRLASELSEFRKELDKPSKQ